jgi:phosphate acetyltransferase
MKHTFFLAPAGTGVGLTTVSLGLVNALDRRGVRVAFFKPISQRTDGASGLERSTHFIRATTTLEPADPIPVTTAIRMISEGRLDELLGQVIAAFHGSTATADVVVIEGLRSARGDPNLGSLNQELVKTLNAEVMLVASGADKAAE